MCVVVSSDLHIGLTRYQPAPDPTLSGATKQSCKRVLLLLLLKLKEMVEGGGEID